MSHCVSRVSFPDAVWVEEHYMAADQEGLRAPSGRDSAFQFVIDRWREAWAHYYWPVAQREERLEERFRRLVKKWRAEVGPCSSVTAMATHPAYQEIIGMGPAAVPLLLRELELRPDHWFWALKAVTGVDPVEPSQRGRLDVMAWAWIRWARGQGIQW